MKHRYIILFGIIIISIISIGLQVMKRKTDEKKLMSEYKIIFLHHSTGDVIYNGGKSGIRFLRKFIKHRPFVEKWFKNYNQQNSSNYTITEQSFPKAEPYGWNNYPYDYYNIWVKNAGNKSYMEEPTLEILTKQYDMIIFKHCFPVAYILEDTNQPNIDSSEKRIENYKLQYLALKQKLNEFPDTKFLIWTGAAQVENHTNKENAIRAKAFFEWVLNEWDSPNDNIFIWDFYGLETEGSLYLKNEYAENKDNSHPNSFFAQKVAPLFCKRIVEVIEQNNNLSIY